MAFARQQLIPIPVFRYVGLSVSRYSGIPVFRFRHMLGSLSGSPSWPPVDGTSQLGVDCEGADGAGVDAEPSEPAEPVGEYRPADPLVAE